MPKTRDEGLHWAAAFEDWYSRWYARGYVARIFGGALVLPLTPEFRQAYVHGWDDGED